MNLVSSFVICGEARTSASLYPARNCAYGFLSACLWFFAANNRDVHTNIHINNNNHNTPTKHQKGELTDLSQMLHPTPIRPKILRSSSTKHAMIRRTQIRTGLSARRRLEK